MEMTLSSCFTLASIKLHITDLMWKGHKDPNSQLFQKRHETFSSFCGSNLSLQCLHHTHLSEPPSILLAPASTWRSSNATTSWKPSLNSQTRAVNSSQPSAHTSVLACLMLWHCLITRLSPRLDLKKLISTADWETSLSEKLSTTYFLWGPPASHAAQKLFAEYFFFKLTMILFISLEACYLTQLCGCWQNTKCWYTSACL